MSNVTAMDDKSNTPTNSASTVNSEDFVLVPLQVDGSSNLDDKPQLKIMSNGDEQLEKAMEEILRDSEKKQNGNQAGPDDGTEPFAAGYNMTTARNPPLTLILDPNNTEVPAQDIRPAANPPEEESVSFHKLSYLGHMKVSAPRSETEALRAMSSMRAHCSAPITVTLYVPNVAEGSVRILDQSSNAEIASFPIYKVLFCVRGQDGTPESDCFAFTSRDLDTDEFQIHVFSCEIKEAVSRILYSFFTAFKRSSKQTTDVKDSSLPTPDSDVFPFTVSLEVKEDDGKGNFRCVSFHNLFSVCGTSLPPRQSATIGRNVWCGYNGDVLRYRGRDVLQNVCQRQIISEVDQLLLLSYTFLRSYIKCDFGKCTPSASRQL